MESVKVGDKVWVTDGDHASNFPYARDGVVEAVNPKHGPGGFVRHSDGYLWGWAAKELVPLHTVRWWTRAWAFIVRIARRSR